MTTTHTDRHATFGRVLPDWAMRGHTQFQNAHGGPAEMAKGVITQATMMPEAAEEYANLPSIFFQDVTPEIAWEWTNRYTDELLDRLVEHRKHLLQVTWSCGFSARTEKFQQDLLRSFIPRAQARGIRICAYHSLTNLFWRDVFAHEPELKDVVARCTNGRPVLYGYSQGRYLACLRQPKWLSYLKQKMRLAIEAGADAVYFDNLSARCVCDRCRTAFSDWARARIGQSLDPPKVNNHVPARVRMQHAPSSSQEAMDSVGERSRQYLWRRYASHTIAEALMELRRVAVAMSPSIGFSANNHLEPYINDVCNIIYSQDTMPPTPRWSNIPYLRYLEADSHGWKPVVTNHPLPAGDDPRPSMAEAMAFQSYPYEILHQPYNQFYDDHPELFTEMQPVAKIGVLLDEPRRRSRLLQPLGRANVMYRVLLPDRCEEADLSNYRVIVLADPGGVSDGWLSRLEQFKRDGGDVIAIGAGAKYDAWGRARPDVEAEPLDADVALTDEQVAQIVEAAGQPVVEIESDVPLIANVVRRADDSRCVVYLVNDGPRPCASARVRVIVGADPARRFRRYSPDDTVAAGAEQSLAEDGWIDAGAVEVWTALELIT